MTPVTTQATTPHPHAAEMEAARAGWYALTFRIRQVDPEDRLTPGYYTAPDWNLGDLVAHIGTWLAEAQAQFERMIGGTYTGHDDVGIDVLNARLLKAIADQPWDVVWSQAHAARSMLLNAWYELREPTEEAAWWIRKAAADHYAQHLPRLEEWVRELAARR
ncbi:MAG TPA: hypothetical protein VNL94_05945 [Candidatus Binatia bacterium]|nr:hypothetical protein [Candidatus Binatia bacterium]